MVKESAFGTSRAILMSFGLWFVIGSPGIAFAASCLRSGCRSWKHRATKSTLML